LQADERNYYQSKKNYSHSSALFGRSLMKRELRVGEEGGKDEERGKDEEGEKDEG
jgi:hypothetical protein